MAETKCMHADHVGPVGKFIFVPRAKAEGHPKIQGPLLCENHFHAEFPKEGYLPDQVWVHPRGAGAPVMLVDHMPAAVPPDLDPLDDEGFLAEVANIKRNPAWQQSKHEHQRLRVGKEALKRRARINKGNLFHSPYRNARAWKP